MSALRAAFEEFFIARDIDLARPAEEVDATGHQPTERHRIAQDRIAAELAAHDALVEAAKEARILLAELIGDPYALVYDSITVRGVHGRLCDALLAKDDDRRARGVDPPAPGALSVEDAVRRVRDGGSDGG